MSDMSSASKTRKNPVPLAERMRPANLDEVIGQQHLLSEGKPLRAAFTSGDPHSMILWGPPGVGKTTLARLMANAFHSEFIALSAVLSGVKDIREAVERAQILQATSQRRTILFVDEVHRFNKSQQDAFLPHVESGLFTFIGATTENPSFEVNSALLSRASVYVLKSLTDADLEAMIDRACERELDGLQFHPDAKASLISSADGDGRKLLNNLDIVARAASAKALQEVDTALLAECLGDALRRFDKGGDAFYDQISALHKSVRGSNPDAALYWMVRMLDGGADPRYLARRIVRMASEDIGLADPRALRLALDAAETYERLGSPEGELALAQAVVYLACAAKSNAVYKAYNAVRALVAKDKSRTVPEHLRNAPTKLMKELGYGKLYRYAHDEPEAYAAGETYLPEGLEGESWYQPVPRGLEIKIAEKLAYLRSLDAAEE
ncbi:replication-associated recombination protein A [Undibacterium sp. RTI2.1]|uniref:replication-associated recombination protein A n=1 Tax=unclassified Undibacterium TaxID=2630295 RepID=UPI002AB532E3|nr:MULTISPECIES: replication-associated recombination protein A [unclassified Undibacterium]MDY7537223.1 replication-associated recombination protein A [Undibacterium sp. 5I1]MEB0031348.1 replication-associated recombination protein A [Undibacterium sp. RTI2.1]MEB0117717.1 replication-associated recombination protein A [Undibacterium sp. RTI2.2]MEB0231512.1 replication-associated recombination protein A [Undibacterium sp. 10I3]MEB0259019.1 replication-associated recombination protein A [Undiba